MSYKEEYLKLKDLLIKIVEDNNKQVAELVDNIKVLTDVLKEEVLKSKYINIDETIIPVVLEGEDKCQKGYVWGTTSVKDKLLWYYYKKGARANDALNDILKSYTGAIQSDGYRFYKTINKDR